MIVYPTPDSLPRIRRSASAHIAGPSLHPLTRKDSSALNIQEEAEVHADLVLQLQRELSDSQDHNRQALAHIEELNQEIQQLNLDKTARELDMAERQRQFALWRTRINQELRESQEASEVLRGQNESLHRQVEELSSDAVTSKTQIKELQDQVSEFKVFWESYSKIEAEAVSFSINQPFTVINSNAIYSEHDCRLSDCPHSFSCLKNIYSSSRNLRLIPNYI